MLIRPKIKTIDSLWYFPSFSCLSIHRSNYMQHLLEKCGNIFQNPSKGLHLIRSFSQQMHFEPTNSLQTLHVTRTIPSKLRKINEHKFSSQLTYINRVNKLAMLFEGVLNSRMNSFQPGGHDTNHNNQQMTKDTSITSQKGQLSQYTKPFPTKPRERASTEEEPNINQNIRSYSFLSFHKRNLCK